MPRFRFKAAAVVLLIAVLGPLSGGAANSSGSSLPLSNAANDEALVEITLPNREAIDNLLAIGVDLAEYRRDEPDGSVTVAAFVTPAEQGFLETLGYRFGRTVEDKSTWDARRKERAEAIEAERNSQEVAEEGLAADVTGIVPTLSTPTERSAANENAGPGEDAPPGEVTIMRADYFNHRSGRFLSVEARTAQGTTSGGPTMSVSYAAADGVYSAATTMSKFTDAGQYMYHRTLIRIGAAGADDPATTPVIVRVASSTGQFAEGDVSSWPGPGLPPYADGYLTGFHTHYMDPVEVYGRINSLANEFPHIAEIIDLPYKTEGYQRKSMAVMGAATPGAAPQEPSRAVLLIAKAYGHEGGDQVQAEFVPGVMTGVTVVGSKITLTFAPGTTAAQAVAAINGNAAASALVTAHVYAGTTGNGALLPVAVTNLDDFLAAPATIPRGQFQPQVIRIGSQRDGSKVGVFLYCQQHAREWATPLTCVETAERLLRNYAIDPGTKELVDNLDIFILPSVNPDGALYSFYDFASQRKNMTRHCPLTATSGMPASRNSWGVDLNRNNTIGSFFDGYAGGGSSCTGETYSGPAEASEPEIKNEHWVVESFPNIKFSNNIHSYGGYFMWAPGAYVQAGRKTLPAPNIGIEGYFFEGAEKILARIKESRGTVILPSRTGPVADVLYSAAGNSADEQWYRRNIIAYSFETGADLFSSDQTGTTQTAVGFMPAYATEGSFEANEFAAGNYGLLETALEYSRDGVAPSATIKPNGALGKVPVDATFSWVNEPSVIHYTTDGSTPTLQSKTWEARGPRQPGEWLHFDTTTTVKWIAEDIRGNVSPVQSATFVVDTVAPTSSASLAPPAQNGAYVTPTVTLSAVDAGGAGVDFTEYRLDGGDWTRYTAPFKVSAVGDHTLEYRSTDKVGNLEDAKMLTFRVVSAPVGPTCTITGTSAADVLRGTNGADVICGLGGNDVIDSLGGNDLILGGDGADRVNAGDGNDEVRGEGGNDDLRGDKGDDTLRGGTGYDKIVGGPGRDTCTLDDDGGNANSCEA